MSDDDKPIEEPIEKFKKLNKKRRFVDTLPENLKALYNEEVKKVLKPSDPRFDPKVAGSICPDQEFYREKQASFIKELSEKLADPNLSDEERAKCKLILTKTQQKQNSMKQLNAKSKLMEEINSSYIKELKEGKIPKFLKKNEIKLKMKEHFDSKRTSHSLEKSQKKKEIKKHKREKLLESKLNML